MRGRAGCCSRSLCASVFPTTTLARLSALSRPSRPPPSSTSIFRCAHLKLLLSSIQFVLRWCFCGRGASFCLPSLFIMSPSFLRATQSRSGRNIRLKIIFLIYDLFLRVSRAQIAFLAFFSNHLDSLLDDLAGFS